MTVSIHKQGQYGDPISEVREPNAAQDHSGNTFTVLKSGLWGPFSLRIDNDEVSIDITNKSAERLLRKLMYSPHLRLQILKDLYHDDRCKDIWNNWEKQNGVARND